MSRGNPIFARFYARSSKAMERTIAEHRRGLLAGLTGRVIEIGAGNGLNFGHYPPEVTEVIAIEPEPLLRRIAEDNATKASTPIRVLDATAERLPVDDGTCDAAVASLVLCTVRDVRASLAELRRVLRPEGQLRFFEHVRAAHPAARTTQRLLDATVWPRCMGGCHSNRDTVSAIREAGFTVDRLDHLAFADTRLPFPASPQILGSATSPAAPE
ncbi:class I SAM-dependent methyltransferase [Spirillospora sp. CA-294931]|uniref:class I SAM-dependent methyltransferase n=1 Tax=Spirillospora sp. CA-294931 TaxID=3240042 RepID=UPI003D8C7049